VSKRAVAQSRDNYTDGKRHRASVERKYARVDGLRALLATHEALPERDLDYIRELKAKLQSMKHQIIAMQGEITNEAHPEE
jgi:hypothetical protein